MKAEETVIVDNITYHPGEEIPDLGSWVAIETKERYRSYIGLSEDVEKLPHYVASGSTAMTLDTSEVYRFHALTDTWYKIGGE